MIQFFKNKINFIFFVAILWQLISVGLIGVGVWPLEAAWVNTALLAGIIIFLAPVDAIGIFLISLPFMIILPNPWLEDFPMWRPLMALVFIVVIVKHAWIIVRAKQIRQHLQQLWHEKVSWWDVVLWVLFAVGIVSVLFARFPAHGLKQIIYVLNAYALYITARLIISTENYTRLLKYLKVSLGITIVLGFVQYILTLFGEPYYFWQYWASMISSTYYGLGLSNVLVYSNSWFSSDGGNRALRMFGIVQDTHAFGVVAIFGLAVYSASAFIKQKTISLQEVIRSQSWKYWLMLVLLCFAVVASGTRGIWIAMLAPAVITLWLLWRYRANVLTVIPLISYALVIALFVLSPFITIGLNYVRTMNTDDNFLNRAASIYDLSENSNAGRLEIWQHSLSYAIHHPLGTGYGNFIVSLFPNDNGSSYEQLASTENERYNLPEKFITAHSLYLHLLVELGLIGLILFLGICVYLAWRVLQALRAVNFQAGVHSSLLINAGLAIAWLLAYGLFDVTILNERVLLYTMMFLVFINFSISEIKSHGNK